MQIAAAKEKAATLLPAIDVEKEATTEQSGGDDQWRVPADAASACARRNAAPRRVMRSWFRSCPRGVAPGIGD